MQNLDLRFCLQHIPTKQKEAVGCLREKGSTLAGQIGGAGCIWIIQRKNFQIHRSDQVIVG